MANVMSMAEVKNRPSRNGFDLSRKNLFTAKVGECLPVAVIECLPGDKHVLKTKWMTRTQPLNTAAYTRIKEYYNWYFVPTNLLWNKFDDFVMGQVENNLKADSINQSTRLSDQHPYVTLSQIWTYVHSMADSSKKNFYGYSRAELTCKLLDMLGYGDFYGALTSATFPSTIQNAVVNLFPLLAYQKIYQDHIRNSQWEKAYAPSANINYISGSSGSLNIPINDIDKDVENMFDLRYNNWNKDYFMGLLPRQQFGDTASVFTNNTPSAVVLADGSQLTNEVPIVTFGNETLQGKKAGQLYYQDDIHASKALSIVNSFSILQLRQAEAVQKMREIMQCHEQDYKSQVEARWNVNVSASKSDRCQWLGGDSANLDISEVVNTNLDSAESNANVKGKGVGVGDGYQECTTQVHGYLLCIYHSCPVLDFSISGLKKHNLKTFFTDYAQPELDRTGMVSMNLIELFNNNSSVPPSQLGKLLGYAPQYYEYKVAYDEVHGAFKNGGLDSWTAPLGNYFLTSYFQAIYQAGLQNSPITYHFFKVYPSVLDPIMAVNADSSVSTDQLLVNCYIDIKSARNLDYNGLPY